MFSRKHYKTAAIIKNFVIMLGDGSVFATCWFPSRGAVKGKSTKKFLSELKVYS
jgi:hypothetical protein